MNEDVPNIYGLRLEREQAGCASGQTKNSMDNVNGPGSPTDMLNNHAGTPRGQTDVSKALDSAAQAAMMVQAHIWVLEVRDGA